MGQGFGAEEYGSFEQLKEKYFIQKVKLGEGSCGSVWRAVNRKTQEAVAMKQIEPEMIMTNAKQKMDSCKREILILRTLQHENIVKLLEAFLDSCGNLYMALEYCDGGDFGDKLLEMSQSFTVGDVIVFIGQICSAVAYLHSIMICHRDIKPSNFMVSSFGSGVKPISSQENISDRITLKLVDFGLAVQVVAGQLLTQRCGTPAFMAPEQHTLPPKGSSKGYSCDADNWASGVTMYCLLSNGRHPFMTRQGLFDEEAAVKGRFSFGNDSSTGSFFPSAAKSKAQQWPEEAFDLCGRLLAPEAGKRIPAGQALQHPFLKKASASRREHAPRSVSYETPSLDSTDGVSRPLIPNASEVSDLQKPSQCNIGCCTVSCSVKSNGPLTNPLLKPFHACGSSGQPWNTSMKLDTRLGAWGFGSEVHEVVETTEDHELEVISLARKLPQKLVTGPSNPNAFYEIV